MSMKINKLEIENVKRVRAVKIEPAANGLTIIGGDNGQGKTSVLDSIAWALGGESFRPSAPGREGSMVPPYLHVVLSNGLVVERKGKNSDLKVTDPSGEKAGQKHCGDRRDRHPQRYLSLETCRDCIVRVEVLAEQFA